ncbi:hypothetical protein, partial [Umezawaea tangerina]|uniref:hypothetical protein n=1 Tax=Umezawaea tangerina TaxID=84725 RepID=UPI001B805B17
MTGRTARRRVVNVEMRQVSAIQMVMHPLAWDTADNLCPEDAPVHARRAALHTPTQRGSSSRKPVVKRMPTDTSRESPLRINILGPVE